MRNRSSLFAILMALAVLPPGLAAAQKLDKDDKKWLDDVRPIVLARRGEDLQGPQGQERPARVPEDLLGPSRSRPRDAGERVPGGVPAGPRDRRPEVPGHRAASAPTPTAAAPSSCSASRTRCRRTRRAAPATSPPRPGPTATGPARRSRAARPSIAFDAECRAPGRLLGAARPHRRGEGPAAQHRLPRGQGRAPDEARRPAPEGHRGPGALQAAAAGLRDRAPGLVPQGRRRRHGAARPRARRGAAPSRRAERRREDRERVGRGQRGGRGREGGRLDGADDDAPWWAPTAPSWPPSSWA